MGRISSGGMMFKAITTVAALVIATSAMAQDDLTISSLAKGETTKAAFNQMVQGHKLPAPGDERRYLYSRTNRNVGR